MLNSSLLYKQEIRQNASVRIEAKITYYDGSYENLDGSRFMSNTVSFDDSSSNSSSFEIGTAIVNTFSCVLNNYDGHFDSRNFTGAIIEPIIKKDLSDGTTENIEKGIYIVDSPNILGGTISITANDLMSKLDVPFDNVTGITYPIQSRQLLRTVCQYCGLSVDLTKFNNKITSYGSPDISIEAKPEGEYSCRDIVSYIAQINGCFAKVRGTVLYFCFYDMSKIEKFYDGGSFDTSTTPYSDGDTLSGGTFAYNDGDTADGGSFTGGVDANLTSLTSSSVYSDEIKVHGIRIIVDDEYIYGDDYSANPNYFYISVENNPLVTRNNSSNVYTMLTRMLVNLAFRSFNATGMGDCTIESGDAVTVQYGNHVYASFITHCNYKIGGYETFECNAETPIVNASKTSATTSAVVKQKNETNKKMTANQVAMKNLTDLMSMSFGAFKTEEKQVDGSIIYYLHNKPTLASSTNIWKMTGNTFTVSTDGGNTWNAGIDASGNAVVNILSAIGINADWINAGHISCDKLSGGTISGQTISGGTVSGATVIGSTIKNQETLPSVQIDENGLKIYTSGSPTEIGSWNDSGFSVKSYKKIGFIYYNKSVLQTMDSNDSSTDIALIGDNIHIGYLAGSPYNQYTKFYMQDDVVDGTEHYLLLDLYAKFHCYAWFYRETYFEGLIYGGISNQSSKMSNKVANYIGSLIIQTGNSGSTITKHNNTAYTLNVVDGSSYIYALSTSSGTVSKSDRNAKNSIEDLNADDSAEFIYSLKPSRYKYNDGDSDRFHHGFIAQDVKESMGDDDWGVYIDSEYTEEDVVDEENAEDRFIGLRYEELIADLVATVQKQHAEIEELKSRIETLEKGE